MVIILIALALVPAVYGILVTGDFFQGLYKPSRREASFVLRNRAFIISASVLLWTGGLLAHLLIAATATWFVVGSAALIAAILVVGFALPGYIMFRTVKRPNWVSTSEADEWLSADDSVIGVEINDDARAYPVETLIRPHVVVDTVGGEPVVVTYCLLSNSAMAFSRRFRDGELRLITPMQWENNLMLYDPFTGHLFQQVTGTVAAGPDAGEHMSSFPTRIMPWGAWKQLYPHTKVWHHPPQGWFDRLARAALKTKVSAPTWEKQAPFFPTIDRLDTRLPNKALVLGVEAGAACKAYPISHLQDHNAINDDVGGVPLMVLYDPKRDAGDVFSRTVDDRALEFDSDIDDTDSYHVIDRQTGSKWDATGRCVAGAMEGKRLEPYPHFSRLFWFSWANFHPDTELALK